METPHTTTRGVLLADGSGAGIQTRAYEDPDLEALREAITDSEVMQAVGRCRFVNRTENNPVHIYLLTDVVTPLRVSRLIPWDAVRPSEVDRMAARGTVFASPIDAVLFCPDLFPHGVEAAKKAIARDGRISRKNTYKEIIIGECPGNRLAPVRYRPGGIGPKNRVLWTAADPETARDMLEGSLGNLALFAYGAADAPVADAPQPQPEPP